VELGSLCSGRIFGACPHGQRQSSSALAETNVMVLLISRADVKTHMANQLASLWNQPVGPTDAALRSAAVHLFRTTVSINRRLKHYRELCESVRGTDTR
jgi:hypothetical protein